MKLLMISLGCDKNLVDTENMPPPAANRCWPGWGGCSRTVIPLRILSRRLRL